VWRLVRRRTPRRGPLPDVPDASPSAVPSDAPGLDLPYSSLDPTAPRSGSRTARGWECLSQSRDCDAVAVRLAGANAEMWRQIALQLVPWTDRR